MRFLWGEGIDDTDVLTMYTIQVKLGAGEGNEVKLATCRFQRCTHSWRTATMDSDLRDVEGSMDG